MRFIVETADTVEDFLKTFNSLYEIPVNAGRMYIRLSKSSFNSLYEIPRPRRRSRKSSQSWLSILSMRFVDGYVDLMVNDLRPFNSLYEIQGIKDYSSDIKQTYLSILSMRFKNYKLNSREKSMTTFNSLYEIQYREILYD